VGDTDKINAIVFINAVCDRGSARRENRDSIHQERDDSWQFGALAKVSRSPAARADSHQIIRRVERAV